MDYPFSILHPREEREKNMIGERTSDGKIADPGKELQDAINKRRKKLKESFEQQCQKLDDETWGTIRTFDTGATRDTDNGKLCYSSFFDPRVITRIAEYLHKHRRMKDGSLRSPDNWKNGIPIDVYMESLKRHVHDVWTINKGYEAYDNEGNKVDLEEALCAVCFNTMGYLFELLKLKENK